jgi:hypothetical protein
MLTAKLDQLTHADLRKDSRTSRGGHGHRFSLPFNHHKLMLLRNLDTFKKFPLFALLKNPFSRLIVTAFTFYILTFFF